MNIKENESIHNISDNNKNESIGNNIDNKYKNLEDPFASPAIPKKDKKIENDEKNKQNTKIMDRIKKGRQRGSKSVDNAKYKKSSDIQKMADKLGERLFKDKNMNQ